MCKSTVLEATFITRLVLRYYFYAGLGKETKYFASHNLGTECWISVYPAESE